MESIKISNKTLEDRTYRQLQQMAKAMRLPSNYKKIHLIELIQAKMYKTDLDVCNIINRVKQERVRLSKLKKLNKTKRSQTRVVFKKIRYSPSITETPKRPRLTYMEYNQELKKAVVSLHPRRSLLKNIEVNTNAISSDRVLRSNNAKTVKTNAALMNDTACNSKPKCTLNPTEMKMKIVKNNSSVSQLNLTTKSYERKEMAIRITNNSKPVLKPKFIITREGDILLKHMPVKRQRTISGIYPLEPGDNVPKTLSIIENVCIRKEDGTYTKVNAVVQKNTTNLLPRKTQCRNEDINIQDIINESVDANLPDNITDRNANNNYIPMLYPTIPHVGISPNNNDNDLIEGELMRYPMLWDNKYNQQLPRIHNVFSQFNHIYEDQAQPHYTQAGSESGINNNHLAYLDSENKTLETIYNINATIPPPCKIAATNCVNSTQTIVSPTTSLSTAQASSDALNVSFLETPSSTVQACPEINIYLDFPELVEDALEIMSRDEDYMQRMGLDTWMQCVLCSWAGPRLMLEFHTHKEHRDLIFKVLKREWNVTFTLESLVQCTGWLNHLTEYDSTLFVLIARYQDPGCLMANLLLLSSASEPLEKTVEITMYNKITGEPFNWRGQTVCVPPDLSFDQCSDCLRVDLSKLDLLPNSANLRLVNREFVTESPSKTIVGQPVLNDIHIIIFLNILD